MISRPTATSFALLGLLGVKPWTAYELVAQTRRSLHYVWPRSEAHLYAELKRLVERGHATAEVVEGRGRQRTRRERCCQPDGRPFQQRQDRGRLVVVVSHRLWGR